MQLYESDISVVRCDFTELSAYLNRSKKSTDFVSYTVEDAAKVRQDINYLVSLYPITLYGVDHTDDFRGISVNDLSLYYKSVIRHDGVLIIKASRDHIPTNFILNRGNHLLGSTVIMAGTDIEEAKSKLVSLESKFKINTKIKDCGIAFYYVSDEHLCQGEMRISISVIGPQPTRQKYLMHDMAEMLYKIEEAFPGPNLPLRTQQ
jgi:hypothetical protein